MKLKLHLTMLIFLGIVTDLVYAQNYDPPGMMVDMGGYKMHLLTAGETNENGAVIFFHGAGDIALHWRLVLNEIQDFAFGIAIDHNGEGWSEHGYGNSINQQVHDSFEVLQKAGIYGPYIVVGHSLGGILAHKFASKYKSDVKGLIMVDATHPDVVLKIYNREMEKMEWKKMRLNAKRDIPEIKTGPLTDSLKISSFQPKRDFGDALKLFSKKDKQMFHWIYNERPYTYVAGQSAGFEAEVFQEMYENYHKYNLGDLPVIVISGGNKDIPEGDENWSSEQLVTHSKKLQKDLLSISSNSKQVIAKKSGHSIHLQQPKLIGKAIKELIKRGK